MQESGIEWCGLIPEHWKVMPNKYVMYKKKELCPKYTGQNILSLTMDGVIVRDLDAGGKMPATFDGYQIVSPNNLLMCLFDYDVTPRCIGLIKNEGLTSPAYSQFVMKDNNKSKYYYYYYLMIDNTKALLHLAKNLRHSFTEEQLGAINAPVPPIEEQQKISEFLDEICGEIGDIIVKTKESIEEYKKYKNAIITEIVTQGLNKGIAYKHTDIDYVEKIPAHWDVLKLRFLGSCQNGISKGSEAFGSGYPFVSYGDVYRNYELPEVVVGLIESTESDRENYSVQYGDVFFTRTSETIEEVGFSSTCLKTIENAVFAGFVIRFRPFNNEKLSPRFSKYYFRSDMHRRFFVKEMNLVTRASLSQELLKKLPVLLPPLEEQEEIADYLDKKCGEIDTLIAKKEAFVEEMEAYKKSLIYEYVTGKKEVKWWKKNRQ